MRRATPRALKRPASVINEPLDVSQSVNRVTAAADGSLEVPSSHPQWEMHFLGLLADAFRFQDLHGPMVLNVWSDCACMGTEMFTGRRLSEVIKEQYGATIEFRLFCFSEIDPKSFEFVCKNHNPRHGCKDVLARNFQTGEFTCSICDAKEKMPTQGIDIYIAGFPCSLFSKKGLRLGMKD